MSFAQIDASVLNVPLASLPAIVLDTETTGLDVAKDRVIEIGAVRLAGTADGRRDTFASLVNPDRSIPAGATAIHGLSDRDICGAPLFAEVMPRLTEWAGPVVIIGYAIGFDLAVLKAECARGALPWTQPRAIDVRHLVQVLAPELPDHALETTAAWLNVEIVERHRATADAEIARQIYERLLPRLREKGIRTLGEAELAIRRHASATTDEVRLGWQAPPQDGTATDVAPLARIDSFPYRHVVRDLMSAPPLEASADTRLEAALAIMEARKVSSLFVNFDDENETCGIITERDVLRSVAAHGGAALQMSVGALAHRPLITIRDNEFVYRALAAMSQHGIRHLAVVADDGAVVGALSARDLLRQRADDATRFGNSIESAATPEELGRIWLTLPDIVRALLYEGVDARDTAAVISRELRALTRRACEFARAELVGQGHGNAPVPFAMLVLGSGGRGESLLAMDQDNAIVYSEGDAGSQTDDWFARLGRRVSDILDTVGVSYCKGGVMAANAEWRMDQRRWRETVASWITRSRAPDILNCDIFFDARAVYGTHDLAERLRADAMAYAKDARVFLSLLALNASDFSSPFNWLGQFRTENSRLDLKRHCIMPIFSAARVSALRHGHTERATADRLIALKSLDIISPHVIDDLIESHRIGFDLILRQQLRDLERGIRLSNGVAPSELNRHEKEQLTWALGRVPAVADVLGTPMGIHP
jgi:CBS domain-containing protein